jgi:L-lactate dehydrogenase complex protein LldE
MKKVALFIPCFIDSIYPNVALATKKILEELGFDVDYPENQTCCGQPLYNSGFKDDARDLSNRFYEIFKDYDYIVAPSASCISMVKVHYKELLEQNMYENISKKSFEICEFLHDIVKLDHTDISFPHTISIHKSCHGLRELNLSTPSEVNLAYQDKIQNLLTLIKDITILPMYKEQECCGFGGTFSINEPELSIHMAKDKISNFIDTKAEYFVGYDNSCMMHLKSVSDFDGDDIKYIHVVEILAGMVDETI